MGYDGVALFDPASGAVRHLSRAFTLGGEVSLEVSPDGRFAYALAPDPGADPNVSPWNVYRVSLDGGERVAVARDVSEFVLSPDGQTLYVGRPTRGPATADSTYAVPAAGGPAAPVAGGRPIAVSPDGGEVLLERFTRPLVRRDLRTGAETPTPLPATGVGGVSAVRWTSAGLFALRYTNVPDRDEPAGRTEIAVEEVLGETRRVLWAGEGGARFPTWAWAWRPEAPEAIVRTYTCRSGWGYDCVGFRETVRYVSAGRDRDVRARLGRVHAAVIGGGEWVVYLREVEGGFQPAAVPLGALR